MYTQLCLFIFIYGSHPIVEYIGFINIHEHIRWWFIIQLQISHNMVNMRCVWIQRLHFDIHSLLYIYIYMCVCVFVYYSINLWFIRIPEFIGSRRSKFTAQRLLMSSKTKTSPRSTEIIFRICGGKTWWKMRFQWISKLFYCDFMVIWFHGSLPSRKSRGDFYEMIFRRFFPI